MSSSPNSYEYAKQRYLNGDPRPLAAWVKTQTLTDEQKEFVSEALLGNIKQADRRTVNFNTEAVFDDYKQLIRLGGIQPVMRRGRLNFEHMPHPKIIEYLADKHGYDDPDSVRRLISRKKKTSRNQLTKGLASIFPSSPISKKHLRLGSMVWEECLRSSQRKSRSRRKLALKWWK